MRSKLIKKWKRIYSKIYYFSVSEFEHSHNVKDVKEKYKQKCESGKKKATQKELKITKDIKEPKF